ncbi:SRPBCC domain-containing protein [Pseudooceanicola sp. CBS1P-1]|uniref:Activator of Hsp90 ATPase homologue 1/2-like C-terminal domain-containing protein n=1 Tax=Pseudooceanicola albus TaxID=2692189 RepID=A0A6L7G0V6_9RHOB|nr:MULTISPECIES: SRPBCC domain-containing protein [Pseudooceanicola]MBT9382587.1 SRPBCC domain-containing protein [Pseudooceanicola endophyticus]MXN17128.1 hypothetical protein [Pseudooceanicola albus]
MPIDPLAPDEHAAGPLALHPFSLNRLRLYRRFAVPRATLFDALHDAALMPDWLGTPDRPLREARVALHPGGSTRLSWGPGEGVTLTYQDVELPGRTVHSEVGDTDTTGGPVLVTTLVLPWAGGSLLTREFWYQDEAARDALLASDMAATLEAGYARLEALLGTRAKAA